MQTPRQSRSIPPPSFDAKLENEEEVLDALLVALSKNQLDPSVWQNLHDAATRDDRVSELAFAYESIAQGRKLKTLLPLVQAELFFRAATFFGDVLGDEFGATTYLERALAAQPGHPGAFDRIDAQLTRTDDNKKLAELCVQAAPHRPRPEQVDLLKRAAVLFERAGLEDKAIETYQQLVRLEPADEQLREALEARYVRVNRFRDVARLLEQALALDPPPGRDEAARLRAKLVEVFANQLKEPERAMPHVEALLDVEPSHAEARRVAMRLLESKGLAARAAAALSAGAQSTQERAHYLAIELENTRGPRRRDVLKKIGILKQDELGDTQGAFEAFEQAIALDPSDDELRERYVGLGCSLKGPLEVARTFARVSTVAKDTGVRSRITAEMGDLLLRGGDAKRARTTLAGVLAATSADSHAVLVAARALAGVYEAENDAKNLSEVLAKVAENSPLEGERQYANERIAQLCEQTGDQERAIAAWRRLVDSPARARALAALEPLYEARSAFLDLSFVLEQRSKDEPDRDKARELAFRAAEVLTTKAKDVSSAAEAWKHLLETYGPARDVYAQYLPILEAGRQWSELAEGLAKDVELAPAGDRPAILARLGQVQLTRAKDLPAAIETFRRALDGDPEEKTSRATLEKMLAFGDGRVAAAAVLEPIYRREENAQGLLRVLEIRAQGAEEPRARLAALEEAADVAAEVSRDRAVDIVARGLGEAISAGEPIATWLERFDRVADGVDRKKRAQLLATALGERDVDSPELAALAKRVGEENAACGDVAAALAAYRRALAYEPSSNELVQRVDELLREQGNPEERVALYRSSLEQSPPPPRRRQLLHSIGSIERYELVNLEAAILAYKTALHDDPTDLEAHNALAELYGETSSWDALGDLLEEHIPFCTSPDDVRRTRAQLAEVAAAHGQGTRAALQAGALLADPQLPVSDLDVVERVAIALTDMELLRRTLERRARESSEPRVQVACLEQLADMAASDGDVPGAIERLHRAAEIARSAADEPSAIAILVRVRELDPRDSSAAAQLAELYEHAEDWQRFAETTRVLLDLATDERDRVELHRSLARTRSEKLGDDRAAFPSARAAFTLAPEDETVLGELEALALRAGAHEDLAEAIDEALQKEDLKEPAQPGDPLWTRLMATKARVLGAEPRLHARAVKDLRAVLEHAKDDASLDDAAEAQGALLRAMPPSEERTADIRRLWAWRSERAPEDGRAGVLAAWARVEEEDLASRDAALSLHQKVLELAPEDEAALAAVVRLSLEAGDVAGALSALDARRSTAEGEARNALDMQIARILAARPGRQRDAIERVATVLETAPHDPSALELAATLVEDPDVGARAAEVLERSLDAVEEPEARITILEKLTARSEPRLDLSSRLLDLYAELGKPREAYSLVLVAARALPREVTLWDRGEGLARELEDPEPLAGLYEEALRAEMPKEEAMELGQRAVSFYEEWFEDGGRVASVLSRLLEVEPQDLWAFDRLKLIYDAQERWDDLFALYDRAAESADAERRVELLEEAAQVAKDFANHSARAIGYLEQLLALKPNNARIEASLERLYERHGCHRELIALLTARLPHLALDEAQKERARVASLWLDELGDASSALLVVEDILAHQPENTESTTVDVTDLLERVLAVAPKTAEMRESIMPAQDSTGRRDSFAPTAPKRTLVRQRAAALLKERYAAKGREADLARVLEVELEAVKSVKERIRRHQQIAAIYAELGNDDRAMEHLVNLVLLEPEVPSHRSALAELAERVGLFERLSDVLVSAADDCHDDALRVELLMHAGTVNADKIGDLPRAIDLFFRILLISPIADAALLAACRKVEPLLAKTGRRTDRLDVLERLAILEEEPSVRADVLGEAARLATSLDEDDRAIWAWEGRLETVPLDPEALDGLVVLFAKASRWKPLIDVLEKRASLGRPELLRRADSVRVAMIQAEQLSAPEDAIATWRSIEETFGESDDGTRALATLYRSTKRWTELESLLRRAAARAEEGERRADVLTELGDVQRNELATPEEAVASYRAALAEDPRNEGARSGLRALVRSGGGALLPDVVRVLLAAYYAADDWQLVLDVTEHRLAAEPTPAGQLAILMEAANVSETRASDDGAAFSLVRRAFLLGPEDDRTTGELFRLAEATRNWRSLADALRDAIEHAADEEWTRDLRFRMGDVLETKLDEHRAALDAFVQVATRTPDSIEAARAVIRVAGRTTRADAAARAFLATIRARETLEPALLEAIEQAANASAGRTEGSTEPPKWDALTFAIANAVPEAGLGAFLARDVEAAVAAWHRDRRGDPEAAEAAFARALSHDPTNAGLLAELARLQRRVRGRPLVDSLLRLSQSIGGDLDLLLEAAETAVGSVGDRALAKSIFDRLLRLAAERWLGATEPSVTSGTPKAPDVYVDRATRELARIHAEDGDHDKVVVLLGEVAMLPWRGDESRTLRHEAARIAVEKMGATERAVEIYLKLVDDDPHDAIAVARLVALYESSGRTTELLELKRTLVSAARSDEERLLLRLEAARLEDELGDVAQSIATLEENLRESARHGSTTERLFALLAREGKDEELEALYASQARLCEAVGETRLAADLHAQAAEVAEKKLRDVKRAMEHLRDVVALEPRPTALDSLARLATQVNDHEAASAHLDRLRELAPANERAGVTLRLADALASANRMADAQERLESEVLRDPEADDVRVRLAGIYRASQAWTSLAELLEGGATHAPDKATRLARLREAAELHRSRTSMPERAIPLLEQAADLSPEDNAVKLALADALGGAGRFEEARTLLRALVDVFGGRRPKERAPVHYHLARLDLAVGDRGRALVELDAATRIDPANPEILQALAELARDDGQLDRAERSYRALLTVLRRADGKDGPRELAISRAEVLVELSRIAERQGEPDRAKEILESAFELGAENENEARRLEATLRKGGDHATLARVLEARLARGKASDEAEIASDLGRLYEEHLGRLDDALTMRLRALALDPTSDATHDAAERVARAASRVEAYEEAVRSRADDAAKDDPELAGGIYVRIGRIAETVRKDDAEAAALYEKALALRPRDRELLASLDRVYERVADDAGQARVLGALVALDAEEGGAPAEALYRLAQLRFRSGDPEAACDAFDEAFAAQPDEARAETLLRAAADAHPTSPRIVLLLERLGRAEGRERSLVDALVRKGALPGATSEAMREAIEVSEKLEDRELVEQLLRKFLESPYDDRDGRVWALSKLAAISEAKGVVREAVLLKREAAELAEPDDARRLLFEVANLAKGPLEDLHLAASILEELHERDATDRDAWEPLLDVYRRMNDGEKLSALIEEVASYVDEPQERSRLRLERVRLGMDRLGLADDEAANQLREIVEEDATNHDAAIMLVSILERTGREEDLAALLARQLDGAKDRGDAEAVSSLSRRLGQLLEGRDQAQARDVYENALDWDPKAKDILLALERMHLGSGEVDARADAMEKRLALETGETAEKLAMELAELRTALADAEGTLRALEVGFEASPQSTQLRDRLEALYREQLEYDKLAHLYETDARGRTNPKAKALRLRDAARIYKEELSNPEEGARVLREARDADPFDNELLVELVEMLVAAGELRGAEVELTKAIDDTTDIDPDRIGLVGRRAVLRGKLGDADGALTDFDEAVANGVTELRPQLAEHLGKLAITAAGRGDTATWRAHRVRIARLRLEMGDIEEARNVLTELLKTDSKDRSTLRLIAELDELEEKWDQASATYRRLVGLEEGDDVVAAALKLAETCEKAGRLADARGGLERARMARPEHKELRARLALLYEQLGATKELAELVLEEARAAQDVAPRFDGLLRAGQLFLEAAQTPDATQQAGVHAAIPPLEEAHALRPADLDCAALLSDAYVGSGRLEEANELLGRTIATFKGRRARELAALYHRLARIAEIAGDKHQELAHLVTALDMDAQNGPVASELAFLAMELGSLDVAQRALRQITMLKTAAPLPKALAYQYLGEIARQQGDVKRAMMLLKRAIDDDPTLQSARALLDALQAEA